MKTRVIPKCFRSYCSSFLTFDSDDTIPREKAMHEPIAV